MASAYVKLLRSIWADPDFIALPGGAQRTYLLLISQPNITRTGVMPYTPGRWASLAANTKPVDIRADIETLAAATFVVLDETTDEICVRSYARIDEGWRSPNGRKGLLRSLERVISPLVRDAVLADLEAHRITLDEGAYEAPDEGATQAPAAASSSQHEPAPTMTTSSSQQQPRTTSDASPPIGTLPDEAAAALIESFIEARIALGGVRSRSGLTKKIRRDVATRRQVQPDVSIEQIAVDECGIEATTARRIYGATPQPLPDCPDCEGFGYVNLAAEGEPSSYEPCACRARGAA